LDCIYIMSDSKIEGAPAHGAVAHLLPQTYKRYISEWLEEDTPSFDYGGFVVGEEMSEAKLLGKSEVSEPRTIHTLNL
jgi:nicotinate-nucleotide pyrophosphorylase (carboxylating)